MMRNLIAAGCLLIAATNAAATVPPPLQADRIVILKSARQLRLLRNGKTLRTYRVSLGSNPTGAKEREGDGKTPEGVYRIDSRNADSKFHRSLHVSYPNAADRLRAARRHVPPGGAIMIHGWPNRWRALGYVLDHVDWTAGCIAVSDADIEEIWKLVPNGTVVEIRP